MVLLGSFGRPDTLPITQTLESQVTRCINSSSCHKCLGRCASCMIKQDIILLTRDTRQDKLYDAMSS